MFQIIIRMNFNSTPTYSLRVHRKLSIFRDDGKVYLIASVHQRYFPRFLDILNRLKHAPCTKISTMGKQDMRGDLSLAVKLRQLPPLNLTPQENVLLLIKIPLKTG